MQIDELSLGTALRITSSIGEAVDVAVRGAGRAWMDCILVMTGAQATLGVPIPYDDRYKN